MREGHELVSDNGDRPVLDAFGGVCLEIFSILVVIHISALCTDTPHGHIDGEDDVSQPLT